MTFKKIIKKIEDAEGNLREHGAVYITPKNMKKSARDLAQCADRQELQIAPYLINLEVGGTYELRHYEFSIEFLDVPKAYFLEYHPQNTLPQEITNNIKPKTIIPDRDKMTLIDILEDYLAKMDKMSFEEERSAYEILRPAKLFYQIF